MTIKELGFNTNNQHPYAVNKKTVNLTSTPFKLVIKGECNFIWSDNLTELLYNHYYTRVCKYTMVSLIHALSVQRNGVHGNRVHENVIWSSIFSEAWCSYFIKYSEYEEYTNNNGHLKQYHQTSNIMHTLVSIKVVDHSDVDGASLVGAAPTTSSFSS